MRKIILFGDSITAGWCPEVDFTDELTKKIADCYFNDEVINAGIPGHTTVDGLERLHENVLKYNPDIVTIFFGANDVATHRLVALPDYLANIKEMVMRIGSDKVILFTTPFVDQRKRRDERPIERIREYSEKLVLLASEIEVPCVNVLTEMEKSKEPLKWLQADGLHFSAYGYTKLAELFNREIKKLKKKEIVK